MKTNLFLVLLILSCAQEHPPLYCNSSNSTLCATICSIRYEGQKNVYDIENQECIACSSDSILKECEEWADQQQNELDFPGLVVDPEIVCVNGNYFPEYAQCICNEGWFDNPHNSYDSTLNILYKCNSQQNPYHDSLSTVSSFTLRDILLFILASVIGCVLGGISIICFEKCIRYSCQKKLGIGSSEASIRNKSKPTRRKCFV